MKLFSSKRGVAQSTEETLFPIFAAIVAFVVILLQLLSIIDSLKQYTVFEKGFFERDIANTIDSLYASPGNIVVDYDKDTKWFNFIFGKNSVNAYEKLDVLLPDNIVYYFTPDKGITYSPIELRAILRDEQSNEENLIKEVNLRFSKTGNTLQIDKKEFLFPNMNEMECAEIENSRSFGKSVFKGFNDISEIDDVKEKKEAVSYGNDVFVWYYPGSYEATQNTIKAFISSEANLMENRRFACLIVNQLLFKFGKIAQKNNLKEITSVAIIPTDSWQMLNQQGYLSVLIEIGNKEIPQENNLWSNEDAKSVIPEAIDSGVKGYG